MNTTERGRAGEELALEFMKNKGYTAVAANFRSRFGEIDLIVKNSEFLVFAEVKTRKDASFAHAREYVGYHKQRKLRATANYWLMSNSTNLQPRFDVIEVYRPNETAQPQINHIENAF